MKTIDAIYENGVFRPLEPVDLPDNSRVRFEPELAPFTEAEEEAMLDEVYSILGERYDSGDPNGSERHNEHQP